MCGILGIVALENNKPLLPEKVIEMNDEMRHRGPDGEGFFFGGAYNVDLINSLRGQRHNALVECQPGGRTIALAHRRLSIIDLNSSAAQPMCGSEDNFWIVFNGEIYNHAEIRQELVKKGHRFKTDHSDTETILKAYEEWGANCVHRLRGMFAIAVWDKGQDTLWICRDRTGIKPLYYTEHDGRFYFASEIKAFLKDRNISRKLNVTGLYHYLSFLTVPAPDTMFENIHKLPAGYQLFVRNGKLSKMTRYWDVFDNVQVNHSSSEKMIAEELLTKLKESVKIHLESDVPVGVFLSGGIDSSTNVALFSQVANEQVRAFSIGYKNDDDLVSYTNEFEYSRMISSQFNCEYHELELGQDDMLGFLPQLPYFQDEPIADPVCVPLYFVSKLARENGVVVAQVGEGADELFMGYGYWKEKLQFQERSNFPFSKIARMAGMGALKLAGKSNGPKFELLERASRDQPIFWSGAEAFYEFEKKELLSDRLRNRFQHFSSWEAIKPHYQKFLESSPEKTVLNWMTYIDLKLRLPELLLMRVDKMSMIPSLEGRVPFLDYRFVEYAMSIPSVMKTKNGQLKRMLKMAVRGLIPDAIIDRKKQGFGAPVYDWYMHALGPISKRKILEFNEAEDVFDGSYLGKLFEEKSADSAKKIWYLMNISLWWEQYINH